MDSYEEHIPVINQCLLETPKIISSSHIEETYGNKNELNELLKKWNMNDLIEHFIEQQLYVEVLKHLDEQTAKNIFSKSNLSLGAQIEFFYHWSKWKKNEGSLTAENTDSSATEETISNLKLGTILNSNPYGLSVLKFYESNSCLNDNSRKLLCDSIIHFCIEKGHALTVKDSENLAKQIVQTFSGEEAAYYHITRQNASPLGKLYNKYRNWKSSINKKCKNTNGSETVQATKSVRECKESKEVQLTSQHQEDEEGHLRVLKHEFNIMSYEEILIHWNGCFEIRQKSFKELCAVDSKKHLVDLWPMLKDSKGFRLINNDFERIYGNPNILLDTFDEFSDLMISKVFPNFVSKFKGEYEMKIWQCVQENTSIENNTKYLIVLTLIPSLLPLARLKSKNSKKGAKFYTSLETMRSFIRFVPTEEAYKEELDKKIVADGSVPPFVTVIGDILKPKSFFCDFENIRYKVFSIIKAVDICFKAYHLFSIKFPEPSIHIWHLLNMQFYKIGTTPSNPAVQMLYKTIQEAEN